MAGRGSRFQSVFGDTPKPLVPFHGHPLFVWSVESVRQRCIIDELCFVVLREHIDAFGIDAIIQGYYPSARIVSLPGVTDGAAITAAHGVAALHGSGTIAVNDCDHAFALDVSGLHTHRAPSSGGYLLGFRADSPAYSYAEADDEQMIVRRVVEKQVISPFAVAGCYFFADAREFLTAVDAARGEGFAGELYMSAIVDRCIRNGGRFHLGLLGTHLPLGTPEEMSRVTRSDLGFLSEPSRS
jgi:dTDP-glucose pyrophosphorylase